MEKVLYRKVLVCLILLLLVSIATMPVAQSRSLKNPMNLKKENSYKTSNDPGNILYVGGSGPDNYTTIQEAINIAVDGDTIFVYDDLAPYNENLQISKSIDLIGENKETTIIDGNNLSAVITLSGECDIQQFTITNGTEGLLMNYKSSNSTIHDNIISNNYNWGISISGSLTQTTSGIVIKKNTFKDNGGGPKNVTNGGVFLVLCSGVKITNNNFMNNNWNAFFFKSFFNLWLFNYWDKPRIFPYPILGLQAIIPPIFWLNFDLRPRLTPN